MPISPTQACPNCQVVHDVGVYVTGQKVRCKCGIHFQVKRTDVSTVGLPKVSGTFAGRVPNTRSVVASAGGAMPAAVLQPSDSDKEVNLLAATSIPISSPSPNFSPAMDTPSMPVGNDRTFVSTAVAIVIPGYELKEVLGKGGMGEVWLARQTSLGRMVAVKLLPPRLAEDPEFVARFDKEATALASLNHPNIVQIIDRGVAGDHYYFAMEYVQGRSLRDILNAERLDPARALKIIAEICNAIDYAHDQQIVHRDLKPENILIDERGHVKVADFGLAGMKKSEERLQLTATSVAMGTINYMAPEQRRDAKNVDGRADLFSLGVMLYELLTGEIPVGRFEIPSIKVPGLDHRVDDIVEKALAQDPAARYARASMVGRELEAVLGHMSHNTGPLAELAPLTPPSGPNTVPGRARNPAAQALTKQQSVIENSWKGIRLGFGVIGAIAVIGIAIKLLFGAKGDGKDVLLETSGLNVLFDKSGESSGPLGFPPNTDDELFSSVQANANGSELTLGFDKGEEELNVHAGQWTLEDGVLRVLQAGSEAPKGKKLIPRAYVAHRYFSSDDLYAETRVRMNHPGPEWAKEEDAQQFAELAFRIKDLQISVLAIPGKDLRLGWRYFTTDGTENTGNSARDLVREMMEDAMPTPPEGEAFTLKLSLKRRKGGTEVEAFVNRTRIVKKFLPGLEGQIGKVALGCRNMQCEFDNLRVVGKPSQRPQRAPAE
jgi:serine/threonine protein kinase